MACASLTCDEHQLATPPQKHYLRQDTLEQCRVVMAMEWGLCSGPELCLPATVALWSRLEAVTCDHSSSGHF